MSTFRMDEQLIDLVRRYEVIYNVRSEEYRDVGLRTAAWEEISKLHGKTVEDCKEDWNKLRNCYNNAIKRRQKKTKMGKKIPPWRFESQMAFLLPHLQGKINDYKPNDTEEAPTSPNNAIRYSPTPSSSSLPVKRKTASICEDFIDPLQYANVLDTCERVKEVDDSDHFFLTMSRMVKKLPKVDQVKIQMDLHKAIYEVQMRELDSCGSNMT